MLFAGGDVLCFGMLCLLCCFGGGAACFIFVCLWGLRCCLLGRVCVLVGGVVVVWLFVAVFCACWISVLAFCCFVLCVLVPLAEPFFHACVRRRRLLVVLSGGRGGRTVCGCSMLSGEAGETNRAFRRSRRNFF